MRSEKGVSQREVASASALKWLNAFLSHPTPVFCGFFLRTILVLATFLRVGIQKVTATKSYLQICYRE